MLAAPIVLVVSALIIGKAERPVRSASLFVLGAVLLDVLFAAAVPQARSLLWQQAEIGPPQQQIVDLHRALTAVRAFGADAAASPAGR